MGTKKPSLSCTSTTTAAKVSPTAIRSSPSLIGSQTLMTSTQSRSLQGYIDARSVRLPTVAIRSGAPSSAASSFISGLIREPLSGEVSECPIASGPDDPILDNLPVYLARTKTVVRNILFALALPQDKFAKRLSRTFNLPGITITPRQILEAL